MSAHDTFGTVRAAMLHNLRHVHSIHDARLLDAMAKVPRHLFVPRAYRQRAYNNSIIPISQRQTMLPPLIVATMLQALALQGSEQILEIGTGSGYVTALLAVLGAYVFSLEHSPSLADRAGERLYQLGYSVDVHIGDGSQGLPDMSPFDAIVVNGAVPRVHRVLVNQLHPTRGRMVLAVGEAAPYRIRRVRRDGDRYFARTLRCGPMPRLQGRYGFPPDHKADV